MGMQIHFEVADIPKEFKVHKHADIKEEFDGTWTDYYIVVDPASYYFSTDSKQKQAWFDIGQLSPQGISMLHWLIQNRICFNAS